MPVAQLQPPSSTDAYASLEAFDAAQEAAASPSSAPAPPLRALGTRPRLLVCHDFQGGYTEDAHAQGYTFEHWACADVYVYFSHQRISLPPHAYVHAAHRHGTRVLGTLIFEWDAARADLRRLLDGPHPARQHVREPLSLYYADKLIDLAATRGIDGFLINVELPLNVRATDNVYLQRSDAMHNAARLRQWVAYLRTEGSRRIPHWHVVWYDSVTYPHGALAWQDALTPANAPFFRAAHGGFTNYTWNGARSNERQPHPALHASAHLADRLGYPRAQVYTGIDVFGRNCFGKHDTWKAFDLLYTRPSHPLGLSVALFAPAWTWEHDAPDASPTSRTWAQWWDEDCALWLRGPHAIAHYIPPRAVPLSARFRTNFALGAGRSWYVRGTQVYHRPWTDASVSAPKPHLAWPTVQYICAPDGTRINLAVSTHWSPQAWSGNVALALALPRVPCAVCVPLLALDAAHAHSEAVVRLYVQGAPSLEVCFSDRPQVWATTAENGPGGWVRYTAHVSLQPGTVHVGLALPPCEPCTLHVGQLDLDTAPADAVYEATRTEETLTWPAFSTDGYDLFRVADKTDWLGTTCDAHVAVPCTDLVEIRRIGAWTDEPVAYA